MAKKTNKTDHVLNLLAGVKLPEQEEEKASDQIQPVSAPPAPEAGQSVQKISVIHTSSSEKDPIAETIRGALEKQAEAMENGEDLTEEDGEEEKTPEEIPPMEPLPEDISERGAVLERSEVVSAPRPDTADGGPKEKQEAGQAQTAVPDMADNSDGRTETKAPKMEAPGREAAPEHKYVFYNVMETLIRDKVLDYMNKFGICTCDRCVTDTTALALNHVPPKYVVIDREAVSPLKNYYERAYVGEITVALSQACIVVGGNPYHDR